MKNPAVLFILYGDRITLYKDLINNLKKDYNVIILHRGTLKSNPICDVYYTELVDDFIFSKLDRFYNILIKYENKLYIQFLLEKLLIFSYSYIENYAIDFIKDNNIKLLYVYNDKFPSCEISFLKSAKKLDIPIILSSQVHIEPDASIFDNNSNLNLLSSDKQTLYQKYIFKKFSGFKDQFFRGYSWYKPFELEALNKKGLLSKKPWIIGSSGFISKLCVSTKVYSDFLLENDINKDIIDIVGAISYDSLYKNLQDTKKTNKIAIVALPQFYEHGFMTKEDAMKEHSFILESLRILKGFGLVISLHPTMKYDDYTYLEQLYPCKIAVDNLDKILPRASLFICTPSTTIQWAILLKIKTIVLDFYDWKNIFWDRFNSFLYINEKDKIENEVEKFLLKKIDFSHDETLLSKSSFDGKVLNRYEELTKKFIKNSSMKNIYVNKFSFYYIINLILKNYKRIKNRGKIKQLTILIEDQNSFYLSPYSNITKETKILIEEINPEIKFNGYIDSFKTGKGIINPKDTININNLILIDSPNSGEVIRENLLKYNENSLVKLLKI